MDNRWRFLYCGMTELWRTRKESGKPGNGKPRCKRGTQSNTGKSGWQWESRDAERNKSSEVREPCVKNSRYCLIP